MSSSLEGVYEPGIVDPSIPRSGATAPFWLSQPHPLADHQSPWPASPVDVAIIGSGVSGANLARTLLSKRPSLRVVLIDARSLCSGATARNGGHIKTMAYAVWEDRKKTHGVEEAIRISAFEHSHLDVMAAAIRDAGLDCDLLQVEGIDAYYDHQTFSRARLALADMRSHAPGLANQYKVYADRAWLRTELKLSPRCVGAIGVPAASLWPYKMVTGLLEGMIESGRLNVQTHTKVEAISEEEDGEYALVKTDRGEIRARQVVHATNAWLGHLLPELRPFISPVRGNVVHYDAIDSATASTMGLTADASYWLRYAPKDYDYLIQRKQGDIVVGRANTGRRATGDDTETDLPPMAHLRGFAHEAFAACAPAASSRITHAWSGILGFTEDAMPFAGRLPFADRGRQWVCGGYHGIGMVKAFRTAEMVALMLLGEDVADEYPRSMLLTEGRMEALRRSVEQGKKGLKARL